MVERRLQRSHERSVHMVRRKLIGGRTILGRATASVPGTCGELVQGMVDDTFFHITCPVNMYSRVNVELYQDEGALSGPKDCPKAADAVRRTLAQLCRDGCGVRFEVHSPLPRGKGMASSTADVVAAVQATAHALGQGLSAEAVAGVALAVEPSDGTMFPGIVAFDHRQGKLAEVLGPPPPIDILVLDFGGTVDTLEFNRVDRRPVLKRTEPQIKEALELARRGVQQSDPSLLGQAATISALANQRILYKPQLAPMLDIAKACGAVGVNVAHSGTVIGVLLDASRPTAGISDSVLKHVSQAVPGLERHYLLKMVGGGAKLG